MTYSLATIHPLQTDGRTTHRAKDALQHSCNASKRGFHWGHSTAIRRQYWLRSRYFTR